MKTVEDGLVELEQRLNELWKNGMITYPVHKELDEMIQGLQVLNDSPEFVARQMK